ncbi:uncharacterized mitochondrial protein-like protein [Tanacetum coccineum]
MRPFGCPVTILNTLNTNSMNYEPVTTGNQSNKNAGIKYNVDAVPTQQYILLPLLYDSPQSSKDAVADDAGKKTNEEPANEGERNGYANSTNRVSTVSPSVSAAGESFTNADDLPTDPLMPDLEDTADLLNTGIFSGAYDDEDEGAEADLNNLETTMNVSPIPTTRIHKDHPKDQIIGDINSATQTRRMTSLLKNILWIKASEKALYSLHQAPRAWYETLSTYLLENRYRRVTIDKTLFIKKDRGDILLVQVYVDDIIFGSTKKSLCVEYEQMMHKRFQISSIGKITFFLGLQVMQRSDGIFISQDKYVAAILKKFDFSSVKTASTLIETNKALLKDVEAENVDVHLYRSMIGSLMYLIASRPDIMFAVCACARFQVTPKVSHLNAVNRIFRYLKGQPKLGLWYPKDSPFDFEAFSDSDYAGASLDRKSTTGGCQFLGKRLISWQCKKQTIVANSTTEAEYVAAANCYKTVYKEWEDRMERAATTASSLEAEQDSGSKIPYWGVQKLKLGLRLHLNKSNDPSLSRVNTLKSGEDIVKLMELMEHCTKLSKLVRKRKERYSELKNRKRIVIGVDTPRHKLNAASIKNSFWQYSFCKAHLDEDMEITATIDEKVKGEGSTILVESHHIPISAPSTSQPLTSPPSMQTTYVAKEAATMPHDSPFLRVHSLGSDEGMKKLEHKVKSSKARRRVRRVVSEDEDELEDPSK